MTLPGDFSATLADEWARAGVRDAVIAPGSRSSPLAIALVRERKIRTHVRLDERSAGFFAIGIALATQRAVVVLTTSGTAAAELHPAVVEADLAGVPLVVCTADRPVELHGVAAPQTIDQLHLYGRAPRSFFDFAVPEAPTASKWRALAGRLVAEALYGVRGPGPVHANLPYREPFDAEPGTPTPGRADDRPWHDVVAGESAPRRAVERLVEVCRSARRGLVVAGRGADDQASVARFAEAFSFPVLSDSLAFARSGDPGLVAAWEPIVKSRAASGSLRPDVVVHLGAPPASRPLSTWLSRTAKDGTRHVLVDPFGRFADPSRLAEVVLVASPGELLDRASDLASADTAGDAEFLTSWSAAEAAAQKAIDDALASEEEANEPATARDLFALVSASSRLVVSSSMPIRDVDAFGRPREAAPVVYSNRGANGIDGVSSTVLGVAAASIGTPGETVGLLGDLAFFYDLSALVRGRHEEPIDATFVVVDNGGGGIFSFLPYAAELDEDVFERALATPQAPDIAAVARSLDCAVEEVAERSGFAAALAASLKSPGVGVVVVRTDRARNVAIHARIDAAVEAAVEKALGSD